MLSKTRNIKKVFNQKLFPYYLLIPAFIISTLVIVYPVINGLMVSFTDYSLINTTYSWNNFHNYIEIFTDANYRGIFFNTFFIVFISVVIQLFFGLVLALLLDSNIPFRNFFRSAVFVIWITPMIVSALLWMIIYNNEFGILNYLIKILLKVSDNISWISAVWPARFALIIVYGWRGIPFFMVMLLAALQTIPENLVDASRTDGANTIQVFKYITYPIIKPILLLACLLSAVNLFQDITLIFILTGGGPINATTTVALYIYKEAFEFFNTGKAASLGIIWLIILAIFAIFYVRNVSKE